MIGGWFSTIGPGPPVGGCGWSRTIGGMSRTIGGLYRTIGGWSRTFGGSMWVVQDLRWDVQDHRWVVQDHRRVVQDHRWVDVDGPGRSVGCPGPSVGCTGHGITRACESFWRSGTGKFRGQYCARAGKMFFQDHLRARVKGPGPGRGVMDLRAWQGGYLFD